MSAAKHLLINRTEYRYSALLGVGGIGSGMFFALDGNQTLGREESRSGRFLDRKDYCKLHIVSHYVKTLLGPDFSVIPIGKVGADEVGERLVSEMREAGLDVRFVERAKGEQTLFSFCFIYPDGAGGNLTINDSACSKVDARFVSQAESEFAHFANRGIALALPEVPIAARIKLLELGTAHGLMRVASFTSAEIPQVIELDMLRSVDLLAVNLEEAASAIGRSSENGAPEELVRTVVDKLSHMYPRIQLSITAGKQGSWSWNGQDIVHVPAFPAKVASTAGAGDAHLAGILTGLVSGLSLSQAQELGGLVAAVSVTSPHTINKELDRESLCAFAATLDVPFSDALHDLLSAN